MSSFRVGVLSAVLLFLPWVYSTTATEPDDLLASTNQFSTIFSDMGWGFPYLSPVEDHDFCIAKYQWWTDFSAMPTGLANAFTNSTATFDGIKTLPLKLVLDVESGGIAVKTDSGDALLTVSKPSTYDAAAKYAYIFNAWSAFFCGGYEDTDECAEGLEPQRLVMRVFLADVNDMPCEEEELTTGSPMESEQEEESGESLLSFSQDGTPCGGSKFHKLEVQGTNFFLEWFSITNATYEIVGITDITVVASNWVTLASLYPAASGTNLTSFVNTGAVANVAKFYKVAKTGISILMCDSNTYSDVIDIPVEIGIPTNQMLSGVTFLVDGEGARAMSSPQPPFTSELSGIFETTLVTNGWHTIQAVATYPSSVAGAGGYQVYTSQVVVVGTQNHITFPDMLFTWGDKLNVKATLDTMITNWSANIWAGDYVEGASNHLLRSYSGITSNGHIDFVWDGKDSNGVTFAAGVFTNVTFLLDDPRGKSVWREASLKMPNFLVSYMPLASEYTDGDVPFSSMIYNIVNTIALAEPYYFLNTSGTGIYSTWKIADTFTGWRSWADQVASNETANLYFFGHTSENQIGNRPPGTDLGFLINEFEIITGNSAVREKGFMKGKIAKWSLPYHFVFLDGCSSAKGNWCEAFGIEQVKVTSAAYTTNGLPAKAFLGWKKDMVYSFNGAFSSEHSQFVIDLFQDWSDSSAPGLQAAVNLNVRATLIPLISIWGAKDLRWLSP